MHHPMLLMKSNVRHRTVSFREWPSNLCWQSDLYYIFRIAEAARCVRDAAHERLRSL